MQILQSKNIQVIISILQFSNCPVITKKPQHFVLNELFQIRLLQCIEKNRKTWSISSFQNTADIPEMAPNILA